MPSFQVDGHRKASSSVRPMLAVDQGSHDALTDLHVYRLALEAERQLADERINTLASESSAPSGPVPAGNELAELRRRRVELAAQLDVVRATIAALRAHADPERRHL